MTNPVVAAGTRIYISASGPSAFTAAAFAALPWTKINGVRVAGELGNNWLTRDDEPLDDSGLTVKKKTFLSQIPLKLEVINLVEDSGQAILQEASGVNLSVCIYIHRKDGGKRYFAGQVTSYQESQGGNGKKVFDAVCVIEPQHRVVFD